MLLLKSLIFCLLLRVFFPLFHYRYRIIPSLGLNIVNRLTLVLDSIETLIETILHFLQEGDSVIGVRGGHVACATEMRDIVLAPVSDSLEKNDGRASRRIRARCYRYNQCIISRAKRARARQGYSRLPTTPEYVCEMCETNSYEIFPSGTSNGLCGAQRASH